VERNIIFPTQDKPKYTSIVPSNENKPAYMHLKLLETDPSQVLLPQSPTDLQKSADKSETETKEISKYGELQLAQKQPV
jgi:hypothetical protein